MSEISHDLRPTSETTLTGADPHFLAIFAWDTFNQQFSQFNNVTFGGTLEKGISYMFRQKTNHSYLPIYFSHLWKIELISRITGSGLIFILIFILITSTPSPATAQTGDILFSLQWFSTTAKQTTSIAWGDYDNDGDLDLVVGNWGQSTRLYRNDGGILTSSAVWSSAEAETYSVAWGDYDDDGDLDLAMGNWDEPNRLYRNDGGILTSSAVWSSIETDNTTSIAWGDYDGDGDLDLVAGNLGTTRLYGNNEGILTTNAIWSSVEANETRSVAWGDYDGDGDLDLVVGNQDNPNHLYRNDGGILTSSAIWSSAEANDITTNVAWGDYDSDGDLDLVTGNLGTTRLYGNNEGILTTNAIWSSVEADTHSVAWGDYDGDGDLDLAQGNFGQPTWLYRNDGSGLMTSAVWSNIEADSSWSVAWGDYDSDSDLDLAVGVWEQPTQLYQNDSGVLTDSSVWSSVETDNTRSVAWGDYDSDGDLDLVVGNWSEPNRLYRNDGGRLSFSAVWSTVEADATNSVAWGDYDGDGDLDLAVGNDLQPNRLYRNDREGLTTNAVWSSVEADGTDSVAWGDYDDDGDLDLGVGNWNGPNRLYRNDGGGLNPSANWSSVETDGARSVAWGDYDGDGDLDLVAGNPGATQLYRNDGGELTTSAIWSSVESTPYSVAWGDYDGDGDLDLAIGSGAPNRLHRNDRGVLTTNAIWSSIEADGTNNVAWGDYDGDGDLDLAVANGGQPNRVYHNLRRVNVSLINDPPYVNISRPGLTDDAFYYSTPQIIQTSNIPINYKLFDPEGDRVPRIFPEYSPNGGGQWFPATPGPGGDGLTNLTASPTGTPHTFIWKAEADLIKNDNVVFRIRAQPGYTHSPILWPAQDGKSPPFRVAAPWYIKVVDDKGNPIIGAAVYANGQLLDVTTPGGLLNPGSLANGTALVALAQQTQQSTSRAGHEDWAYRTYLTNLSWGANGQPHPFIVNDTGEQRLVVRQPLVFFNLLVSIEWDADDQYINQIARAMQSASDYLYDLTDGQMAFGQVTIYDNGSYWAEADIQISTKNIVRPHAYIGGITSNDKSHVIRVGRFWDGNSGSQGAWDQLDGFRTLTHEFGHYGLYLYDEYFVYGFDSNGNLTGEIPASCTGPENRNPVNDSTNGSVMDYQYTSSEFSARNTPGLWSALCEQTAQWQFNNESPWETIVRKYADTQNPSRWQFTTPISRSSVLAGPIKMPSFLPNRPLIQINQSGPSTPPRQLTIYGPQGPYWGAIVALYKQDGRVIGQGFTNGNGQLDVYGALEGDIIRAASFDGGLAGNVTVGVSMSLNLPLNPVRGLTTHASNETPHLRVIAEPSPNPNQIDLLVALQNFGAGADPSIIVTEPGSESGYAPTLSYSPSTGTYQGQISFSATEQGIGRIQAVGTVGSSLMRLQSTYRLQQVRNNQGQDIYSDDGNLSLYLEPGSLPSDETYLVVMPPGAVPGPLPAGLVLVGDTYAVTASGALITLMKPGILKLHYDGALVNATSTPEGMSTYRWNPDTKVWQVISSNLDNEQKAMVASITTLGTYALLAPPGPWSEPMPDIFLPLIIKNTP